MDFVKYPRTPALSEKSNCSLLINKGQILIVEEKMDGTQVGLQFDHQARPMLQSRGTIISSEAEFAWLKSWVWQHHAALHECLRQRYILFGEWLWAKHTIFYDCLPHYWLEFDVYDREQEKFLSTAARQQLLSGFDFLHSVRVIDQLMATSLPALWQLIGESAFISEQAYKLLSKNELAHTDTSGLMEGLYLKVEDQQQVVARYKLVRPEFIEQIVNSKGHWRQREVVRNRLEITSR